MSIHFVAEYTVQSYKIPLQAPLMQTCPPVQATEFASVPQTQTPFLQTSPVFEPALHTGEQVEGATKIDKYHY